MATDKLFNVAGVSKQNGEYKVRFATDIMRIKVLAKHGHTDIRLEDLGTPVTKYALVTALKAHDGFQDAAAQSAIAEYLEDKAPKAVKATVAPKAKAKATTAKAPKDTKASREAQALAQARAVAEAEDAPY